MQYQHITTIDVSEIEVNSRRAWGLTSMLMTYINQGDDEPSSAVMNEALSEIWERLDAIGAAINKGAKQ